MAAAAAAFMSPRRRRYQLPAAHRVVRPAHICDLHDSSPRSPDTSVARTTLLTAGFRLAFTGTVFVHARDPPSIDIVRFPDRSVIDERTRESISSVRRTGV